MTTEGSGAGEDELALSFPPEPEYVGMARLFAASIARHLALEEDRVEDLKVAISEACTNSVKAHRDANVTDAVRVVARVGDAVTFEVIDWGRGFELASPDRSDLITPPAGLYEGSFGLTLIRALFEDAEIRRNEQGGTTVRFSVALPMEAEQDARL